MDASSQLLTAVKFDEAKRGYHKDQVDGFLRELSAKVGTLKALLEEAARRAETAEIRSAEAEAARDQAERDRLVAESARDAAEAALADLAARAAPGDELVVPDAGGGLADEVAAAPGVLTLAQQTAEAAIAEAEAQARRTVEDAEIRAAVTLLEAEQRSERLKREALDGAERLRVERVAMMESEVQELIAQRDALEADIVDLHDHVEDQRRRVRDALDSLMRVLDGDPGLSVAAPPELRVVPSVPAERPDDDELGVDTDDAVVFGFEAQVVDLDDLAAARGATEVLDTVFDETETFDVMGGADDAGDDGSDRRALHIAHLLEGPEPLGWANGDNGSGRGEPSGEDDATPAGDGVAVDGQPDAVVHDALVAEEGWLGDDLDDVDDVEGETAVAPPAVTDEEPDGAEPAMLDDGSVLDDPSVQDEGRDASPLGQPGPEADTAMREFFEEDEEEEKSRPRRSGRRRRR